MNLQSYFARCGTACAGHGAVFAIDAPSAPAASTTDPIADTIGARTRRAVERKAPRVYCVTRALAEIGRDLFARARRGGPDSLVLDTPHRMPRQRNHPVGR